MNGQRCHDLHSGLNLCSAAGGMVLYDPPGGDIGSETVSFLQRDGAEVWKLRAKDIIGVTAPMQPS
jgi:hypothetical protein